MMYKARVEVGLRSGHSDPEGETTARSLIELGYCVKSVAVSKIYLIILEADSEEEAKTNLEDMCRRLLANPTKDHYTFQVETAK
ncbi:MAG: phosphoribosylformylglycinamidine synthase subunit PurS [Candidatus Bathyarchaeota archaeon]|jgi:phosphoribosylformylglycinamidine synthase|nr:MAG: phosphoribosylformylglycinamidine synthase subunit PurS [Candidatus Bathyarchaeota archaeon]